MQMLRCRICGETYLGTAPPTRCPFCGAAQEYFTVPGLFLASEDSIQPTELERSDLEMAIEIERSNARFYVAMAALTGDEVLSSAYKRLSRIEAEHCSLFSRMLGRPKPDDLATPDGNPASWCEAIEESARREAQAATFYAEVMGRATNERMREVFEAVSAVERDHLALDALAAEWAGCTTE